MVPLLVPGVRKEHQDFIEAVVRDMFAKDVDGVVANDAHIFKGALLGAQQKPPHARSVHLDAQVVDVRIGLGQGPNHFPRAEADFQAARRRTPENGLEIQRHLREVDAVGGP